MSYALNINVGSNGLVDIKGASPGSLRQMHERPDGTDSPSKRRATGRSSGESPGSGLRPPAAAPAAPQAAEAYPTSEADIAKNALGTMEKLLDAGKMAAQEEKFAVDAGLPPARALRARRKSKDLQQQAMELMGDELEKAFKQFDLDGSGTLDQSELKAAFRAAGRPCTDSSIKKCITMLDANNDGVIDLQEFKAMAWFNEVMPR